MNNLEKKEAQLAAYQGEDRMISSLEMIDKLNSAPAPMVTKTGVPTIDRLLNGIEGGELIVVTGPTGGGKTTLMMTITRHLAEGQISCAWFTMEETPRQFMNKLQKSGTVPLFYLPAANTENHIAWLVDRIIEGCVKYNTRIVFIDNLHFLFSLDKMNGNMSLEIGDIVTKIKKIAIDFGLSIFLIAHNVDNKLSPKAEPNMRDIRDSGMISRTADTVLGVWRIPTCATQEDFKKASPQYGEHEEGDCHTKVRIFKNRREGTLGYFFMQHNNHILTEIDIKQLPDFEVKKSLNDKPKGYADDKDW